jgi:hypothetical protein
LFVSLAEVRGLCLAWLLPDIGGQMGGDGLPKREAEQAGERWHGTLPPCAMLVPKAKVKTTLNSLLPGLEGGNQKAMNSKLYTYY